MLLKFATFQAPTSCTWLSMHKAWMDKVEKDSGGRIRFEGYPAMQLGRTVQAGDAGGRKPAADRGNRIRTFTAAEAQEFARLSEPIDDEWVDHMNKRGFDGRDPVETGRDLIARHGRA